MRVRDARHESHLAPRYALMKQPDWRARASQLNARPSSPAALRRQNNLFSLLGFMHLTAIFHAVICHQQIRSVFKKSGNSRRTRTRWNCMRLGRT
jgi:hypothetical protein